MDLSRVQEELCENQNEVDPNAEPRDVARDVRLQTQQSLSAYLKMMSNQNSSFDLKSLPKNRQDSSNLNISQMLQSSQKNDGDLSTSQLD